MTSRWILAVIVCALGTDPAWGRVYYVDNMRGDDRFDGRSPQIVRVGTGPVHSISKALARAEHGDRIVVANTGQPYYESISVIGRHSGSPDHPFVIEGNGATLNGSAEVPDRAWEAYDRDTFRFRPSRLVYHQLFLDGRPAQRAAGASFGTGRVILAPREWALVDGYLYFRLEPEKYLDDYHFSHTVQTVGITLYQVHDVVIRGFQIEGFQLDGINAHDTVDRCTLDTIHSRANGRSGIAVGGCSHVAVRRADLSENGETQLLVADLAVVSLSECKLSDEGDAQIEQTGGTILLDQ